MNVLEEWKEKRERGSDEDIDKYHFDLSNSVPGAAMCYHERLFWFWYVGIRRICNIIFPVFQLKLGYMVSDGAQKFSCFISRDWPSWQSCFPCSKGNNLVPHSFSMHSASQQCSHTT